uniref:Uncharacterized protein n=1 Tax=Meloidogyne enterolobii TaxID=390850 RepID=A0A6V7WZA7_MELEN|nr:unnamed protein product [Meloidogyne enterolobii]
MPYSFVTEEIISNEVHNKFIFMVNPNASEFYITLMHGEPDENEYIGRTVYGLFVNFTENTVTFYSMEFEKLESKTFNNTLFQQGELFEFIIIGEFNVFDKSTTFYIKVNGKCLMIAT